MSSILIALGAVLFIALSFLVAAAIATRIVFGFSWSAIIGLRREAKRNHVVYVSRGPFQPTAVFWLGATDDQEDLVARAMAEGEIHRQEVNLFVSKEAHWNAIVNGVQIWPTVELRKRFGEPRDVVANSTI